MSKDALKSGHAEHIHPHCDCTYSVRFDKKGGVKGYNPEKYRKMYENAEGNTPREKINSMRRIQYQKDREKILEQKRANYQDNIGIIAAAGKLPPKMQKYVPDYETRMKIINDGIESEKPIFVNKTDDLYKAAIKVPPFKDYYTVVLHGNPYSVEYKGVEMDADTLCAIIAQRKDYKKGTDILLISCYTGS